jgi:site-specific recombinase XerD
VRPLYAGHSMWKDISADNLVTVLNGHFAGAPFTGFLSRRSCYQRLARSLRTSSFSLISSERALKGGLSPVTVRCYAERAGYFLDWYAGRFENAFAAVRPSHILDYMDKKVAAGWTAQTRARMCQALRSFFRHAEARGWCIRGIARCIKSPRLPKYEQAPRGPAWKDVRRLIEHTRTDRSADVRALRVLLLCSV